MSGPLFRNSPGDRAASSVPAAFDRPFPSALIALRLQPSSPPASGAFCPCFTLYCGSFGGPAWLHAGPTATQIRHFTLLLCRPCCFYLAGPPARVRWPLETPAHAIPGSRLGGMSPAPIHLGPHTAEKTAAAVLQPVERIRPRCAKNGCLILARPITRSWTGWSGLLGKGWPAQMAPPSPAAPNFLGPRLSYSDGKKGAGPEMLPAPQPPRRGPERQQGKLSFEAHPPALPRGHSANVPGSRGWRKKPVVSPRDWGPARGTIAQGHPCPPGLSPLAATAPIGPIPDRPGARE